MPLACQVGLPYQAKSDRENADMTNKLNSSKNSREDLIIFNISFFIWLSYILLEIKYRQCVWLPITKKLEGCSSSLPAVAASFCPYRLGGMSSILCLWLCECKCYSWDSVLPVCLCCLLHTQKSYIQNKEKILHCYSLFL